MTNQFSECRNSLHIECYELETDYLYLNGHNVEIHITSNNVTELQYDDFDVEQFTIRCKDNSEVILIF